MKSDIKICPNPISENDLTVFFNNTLFSVYDVKIVTMDGRTVLSDTLNMNSGQNHIKLNVSNLENGSYILELKNKSERYISKIIISR